MYANFDKEWFDRIHREGELVGYRVDGADTLCGNAFSVPVTLVENENDKASVQFEKSFSVLWEGVHDDSHAEEFTKGGRFTSEYFSLSDNAKYPVVDLQTGTLMWGFRGAGC